MNKDGTVVADDAQRAKEVRLKYQEQEEPGEVEAAELEEPIVKLPAEED